MLFVDGENFTIRGQEMAAQLGKKIPEGSMHKKDVFLWYMNPLDKSTNLVRAIVKYELPWLLPDIDTQPVRCNYYTSTRGDEHERKKVKETLRAWGFHSEVFRRDKRKKAKAVDIMLTKDMLWHGFYGHYDVAILVAGDEDYLPLVQEVMRMGRQVYVAFFTGTGLSDELRLTADYFLVMDRSFSMAMENEHDVSKKDRLIARQDKLQNELNGIDKRRPALVAEIAEVEAEIKALA
jgi:uncharacterized LabA/DUF88 family protein